jgi:hydrogenase maturation protease
MSGVTKVIGIGSHHGDDQAGWIVAQRLLRHKDLPAEVVLLRDPAGVLEHVSGCDRLILIDACMSGDAPGTIKRLEWPDSRLQSNWGTSTHGISACEAMQLLEQLHRRPRSVIFFGVEAESFSPAASSEETSILGLAELEAAVLAELAGASET